MPKRSRLSRNGSASASLGTRHSNLISRTSKADMKALGVKLEGGMIFKNGIAFGDLPLDYTDNDLFLYLRGMSAVYDNKDLWFKGDK